MIANVIADVAEGKLETLTERVTAGKRAVRKAGRFQGGVAPFGYKSAEREGGGRELVKDPEQQEVLQWIFQQTLLNRPMPHIARDLNNGEVQAFARNSRKRKLRVGTQRRSSRS